LSRQGLEPLLGAGGRVPPRHVRVDVLGGEGHVFVDQLAQQLGVVQPYVVTEDEHVHGRRVDDEETEGDEGFPPLVLADLEEAGVRLVQALPVGRQALDRLRVGALGLGPAAVQVHGRALPRDAQVRDVAERLVPVLVLGVVVEPLDEWAQAQGHAVLVELDQLDHLGLGVRADGRQLVQLFATDLLPGRCGLHADREEEEDDEQDGGLRAHGVAPRCSRTCVRTAACG